MNIAIILSGGVGTRMGTDIPKQYIEVAGRPIISYSLANFLNREDIEFIIIAMNSQWIDYVKKNVLTCSKKIFFTEPGETREFTIYNALKKAKELGGNENDIVIVHDAVRPLVSDKVISDCLIGCSQYDASIATIDVKDTIYTSTFGGCITDVPNRSVLHAGQTPEAFKLGKFLKIHDDSSDDEIRNVTGGAQFAFQKGLKVFLSKGEDINFKITTPEDLKRFIQIITNNSTK